MVAKSKILCVCKSIRNLIFSLNEIKQFDLPLSQCTSFEININTILKLLRIMTSTYSNLIITFHIQSGRFIIDCFLLVRYGRCKLNIQYFSPAILNCGFIYRFSGFRCFIPAKTHLSDFSSACTHSTLNLLIEFLLRFFNYSSLKIFSYVYRMTPEDVKQYIEKIYQVKILQVTTEEIRNESKIYWVFFPLVKLHLTVICESHLCFIMLLKRLQPTHSFPVRYSEISRRGS